MTRAPLPPSVAKPLWSYPWRDTDTHAHPDQDSPALSSSLLPQRFTHAQKRVLSLETPRPYALWQLARTPLVHPVAKSAWGLTLGHHPPLCPGSEAASPICHLVWLDTR